MGKTMLLWALALTSVAYGYEAKVTQGQLPANLNAMLFKASNDTGINFLETDFMEIESRELATSKFTMFVQTSSMIPVAKTAIRIWSDLKTGDLILAEMHLSEKTKTNEKVLATKLQKGKFGPTALKSRQLNQHISRLVTSAIQLHGTDNRILGMKFKDQWVNGDLVREVEIRGRRGVHHVTVSLLQNLIIEKSYQEFPQGDATGLMANVFPIYEEDETSGTILATELKELKYVNANVIDGGNNPLGTLSTSIFSEEYYYPLLAGTPMGDAYGLWSEASLRMKVEALVNNLPKVANDFNSGILLQGKYATVNLHPDVKSAFTHVNFPLNPSANHILTWKKINDLYHAQPTASFLGKRIMSETDLLSRVPVRLADHDPTTYINAGFDEVQVYYAVTVLMEALAEMGFTDPELSVRPFHAFLYDPDIGMKDNAYYTDNTINFTTYNPKTPNLARDNSTIWHELGHGVMDRLMGAHLGFADSKGGYGGLSEGMADFVAKLVIEQQTNGTPFPGKEGLRINNKTGFYLTNEFHDEGEAYGGVMSDMLEQVISAEGKAGLVGFTDLTLEAMRLTRNHPALSAAKWFDHMLYADDLGSSNRQKGQYRQVILNALKDRNFSFDSTFKVAEMNVTFDGTELTNESEASRERPIEACDVSGNVHYDLELSLTSGTSSFIQFPAIVKVEYKTGALQGAIKWEGEATGPTVYEIKSESDRLSIPLKASMKCDSINQPDGSCKDYAYIQVFNQGGKKPVAKKRFYLKIQDGSNCQ